MITLFKKLIFLLNSSQKNTVIFLFFLILVGMLFEVLGIGLIIPVFSIIIDPNFFDKYILELSYLIKNFSFDFSQLKFSKNQVVIFTVLLVVIIYTIKNCFLGYLFWKQNNFIRLVALDWSKKLFSGYLYSPYSFHLKSNSAYLLTNILHSLTIAYGIESLLILAAELLVIFGIGVLLLSIEPIGALAVILTMGFCSYFFYLNTRKYLSSWGKERHYYEGQKHKHFKQAFDGIKDLKVLGREKNFFNKWEFFNKAATKVERNLKIVQILPRFWLELVTIIGLSILLIAMTVQNKPINNIIPIIGVFGAAAYRIIPSINRILGSLQRLRFDLPLVNIIHKELTETIKIDKIVAIKNNLDFNDVIKIDKVNFSYESRPLLVLSNISANISIGSQVGFVGESGSGKTTLVDIILGLLRPSDGFIKVDGTDIQKNLSNWQKNIGYVPQDIYLSDDTLRNNIAYGLNSNEIDEKSLKEATKVANLDKFIKNLPDGLNTMVGEHGVRISGGQRQRVGIARALYSNPNILILDEATSSLDINIEKEIMKEISKLKGKKTVIIVAHRLSTVSQCDKLFKLEKGKIIKEGSYEEVISL